MADPLTYTDLHGFNPMSSSRVVGIEQIERWQKLELRVLLLERALHEIVDTARRASGG